ncbi:cathepsin O isoform X2 [Brachyhypopomus gauderio]|uniref:cathepsin O isoform X2 n=1 Tax=Brachyhypopomus gauderio TaxID=698409 RepID=UPI0040430895
MLDVVRSVHKRPRSSVLMAHVEAFVIVLYLLIAHFTSGDLIDVDQGRPHLDEQIFESFNQRFNRSYGSTEEYVHNWIHFHTSVKRHDLLNSQSKDLRSPAKYGINQFSNLSPEQFRDLYLRAHSDPVPRYNLTRTGSLTAGLPRRFDWRDHGAIGPVPNQQSCGGCWAFSVVGAVEAVCVKDGGTLQSLSVQQVIDCDYDNQGCHGGSTVAALDWLKKTKEKLVKEAEYPYKAEKGICCYFPQTHGGAVVGDYAAFSFSQELAMQAWLVDRGPLVVTVDATSWQDYLGGVIQHHCSGRHANHAVLITGFDTTGEVPFWIVRNSWGPLWGVEGYVYVKMGDNTCGVADTVATVSRVSCDF